MSGKATVTKAVADAISCGLGIYGESKETFIRRPTWICRLRMERLKWVKSRYSYPSLVYRL